MLDIMGCFISDGGSVPQNLLDIVLECLLPKMQTMNPSAFELAKDLLRRTTDVVEQSLLFVRTNHSHILAHYRGFPVQIYVSKM